MKGARAVRVYVCSDFRDMRAERRVQEAIVFPELSKRALSLGLELAKIDPCYGANEEENVIGLLGERYGKVLDPVPEGLLTRHPWLRGRAGLGLLELELLLAERNLVPAARRSFFYLRDPRFLAAVPPDRRGDFQTENALAAGKLGELKFRIRSSGRPVFNGYPCRWDAATCEVGGLEAFARQVIEDLWAAISTDYPQGGSGVLGGPPSTLLEHKKIVVTVAISCDGKSVFSGDRDGVVKHWGSDDILSGEAGNTGLKGGAGSSPREEEGADTQPRAAPDTRHPDPGAREQALSPPSKSAVHVDENVQFTVYRPGVVEPGWWYPMLAFAHLEELPDDAPEGEPEPLEEVKRQARQILGSQVSNYKESTEESRAAVPREGEITFVPRVDGARSTRRGGPSSGWKACTGKSSGCRRLRSWTVRPPRGAWWCSSGASSWRK
jgi:hypothetical protein